MLATRGLKAIRQERGLSQEQLGALAGVTTPTVSRWESGEIQPSAESMVKLSRALKVPIARLFPKEERV